MISTSKYLVVIAGPTAAGKTALSIQLAEMFKSEILSADSRQFYNELSIGTAKPKPDQLKKVKHHFINTKSISELYGAGHYEKDAIQLLETLFKDHQILFLVGGSGLYINAVLNGVDEFIEIPAHVREELNSKFEENGLTHLQEELKKQDPVYYAQVDLNNPQRIIRALEVCYFTKKTFSSFLNKKVSTRSFKIIPLLITPAREELYLRINERVNEMMVEGLLDEVKALREFRNLNALKTVGYKELNIYLDGEYNLDTAVEKIKQHSRNYAKRQLTWFRNQGTFKEFSPFEADKVKEYIRSEMKKNQKV